MPEKKLTEIHGGYETAAWNFMWKHKKTLLALIALPSLILSVLAYFFHDLAPFPIGFFGLLDVSQEGSMSLHGRIVNVIFTASWFVGWLKYMLADEKLTFNTYFKWGAPHFVFMVLLLVFSLGGTIDDTGAGTVWEIGLMVLYFLILPFRFLVPSMALGKKFSLRIWMQVKPFYWGYLGSLIFMSIRIAFLALIAFGVLLGIDFLLRLKGLYMGVSPYRCLNIIFENLGYAGMASVTAMYYKYRLNK